jgi:hypothetical protein
MYRQKIILSMKIFFFADDTKNVGFRRNDFMSTLDIDMYASIFCSNFLAFQTAFRSRFKNREHMFQGAKTHHP